MMCNKDDFSCINRCHGRIADTENRNIIPGRTYLGIHVKFFEIEGVAGIAGLKVQMQCITPVTPNNGWFLSIAKTGYGNVTACRLNGEELANESNKNTNKRNEKFFHLKIIF